MGYLQRGTWVDQWYDTASSGGRFVRQDSRFRSWIGQDPDYPPEAGRYHLYVSWACPWAHRTLIYRVLKALKDVIGRHRGRSIDAIERLGHCPGCRSGQPRAVPLAGLCKG